MALRNAVLLVASLVFYTWGAGELVSILLFSILFNFAMGLVIGKAHEQEKERRRNALVAFDIIVNLSLLGYYKYFSFGAEQFSAMWKTLGFEPLTWSSIALPIGISFFTFHGLSYCVDSHGAEIGPMRKIADFGQYMRCSRNSWRVRSSATTRSQRSSDADRRRRRTSPTAPAASPGAWRRRSSSPTPWRRGRQRRLRALTRHPSFTAAWIGVLAYTIQIYFDFSGYSDMAIGLARMFGFRFPENFNRPYSAVSITDFWRRWHMTLSNWFRDYLYIPLGGNSGSSATDLRQSADRLLRDRAVARGGLDVHHLGPLPRVVMLIERVRNWRFLDHARSPPSTGR